MHARTRVVLVTVLLGMLVATAGCTGGDGGTGAETDTPTDVGTDVATASNGVDGDAPAAAALRANASGAMETIETGRLTQEMTVTDDSGTQTVMHAEGVVDTADRRMRLELAGAFLGDQTMTRYVLNDTVYSGLGGRWVKAAAGDRIDWNGSGSQFEGQGELLEGAGVEVTGTDEIDGNEVWVVSARADASALPTVGEQPGSGGLDRAFANGSVEITQYVDRDTNHIRRSVATMNTTRNGQAVSITMTTDISEIDEPVTIELPAAAKDAPSLPSGIGGNASAGGAAG